jgi:poly-beta-1,6-N-acetyl-D-glucosamine N-deacetylase
MVDPVRPPGLTRRQFVSLAAAVAAVPVIGGCNSAPAGSGVSATTGTSARTAVARVVTAVARNSIRPQVDTPAPVEPGWTNELGLRRGVSAWLDPIRADSLLVLSYHNVSTDGLQQSTGHRDKYTVAAADLAAQMQMLRLSGYRSVRLVDVLTARRTGTPLPPRSVLITFDDGGAGQWVYADRILAEAGFTAVSFLITGHLSSSEAYLSWAEAVALARTGRWDIGAHTHDHHHFVATGDSTPAASVLINRVWDPQARTLQGGDAARSDFDTDLATSLALLAKAGLGRPQAFAYPFSQVDDPTNDIAFATYVRGRLAGTFPLLMTNTAPGRTARPEDLALGLVPRVEVHHDTSALNLFELIRAADTTRPAGHVPSDRAGG